MIFFAANPGINHVNSHGSNQLQHPPIPNSFATVEQQGCDRDSHDARISIIQWSLNCKSHFVMENMFQPMGVSSSGSDSYSCEAHDILGRIGGPASS